MRARLLLVLEVVSIVEEEAFPFLSSKKVVVVSAALFDIDLEDLVRFFEVVTGVSDEVVGLIVSFSGIFSIPLLVALV